ncbi:hypothetical protein ACIRQF_06750 [Streptomyces sp. NPDC101191]|uniref:hypothetical protein n=1 Tax=Streptomyces sp. NPDC101191 TaxID=3366126 RepID=UPI003822A58D
MGAIRFPLYGSCGRDVRWCRGAGPGRAWLDRAWLGWAWLGWAWLGWAWLGWSWLGRAWLGRAGPGRPLRIGSGPGRA